MLKKWLLFLLMEQILQSSHQITISRGRHSDIETTSDTRCDSKTLVIRDDETQSIYCIGSMHDAGCYLTFAGSVKADKTGYIDKSSNNTELTISLPSQPYLNSGKTCQSHSIGKISVQVYTLNLNKSVWNDDIGENAIKPTMSFHINETEQTLSVTFKEHWDGILMKIYIHCNDENGQIYVDGDASRCVMVKYGGTVNYPLTGSRFFPSLKTTSITTTPSKETTSQTTTENTSSLPNTLSPEISSSVQTTSKAGTHESSPSQNPGEHSSTTAITPAPISGNNNSDHLPLVAGIAGAILFLLLVILIIVLIMCKKKKSSKEKSTALTNMKSTDNAYVQYSGNHSSTTIVNVNAVDTADDFIGYKSEPDIYDAPITHEEPKMLRPFDEYAVVDKSKKKETPLRSSAYIFMGPDQKKPDDSQSLVKGFDPVEIVIPAESINDTYSTTPVYESAPYTEL